MERNSERYESVSSGNISYYNRLAEHYDAIQNDDKKNTLIRNRVAEYFITRVKQGNVLDFGGGTGLDLSWLVQQPYNILFCEPSEAMRRMAIQRKQVEFPDSSLLILESYQSDFRKWNEDFPFRLKINAVLANFAVINCIPDIQCLFEKLALVMDPGGLVVALVLDGHLLQKFRTNLKGTLKFLINRSPVCFQIDFNGERQLVNLYSVFEIRKAAIKNFDLVQHERLGGFGFSLIHLVRK